VKENKSILLHSILFYSTDGWTGKGVDGVPADEGCVCVDLLARHPLQLTQQAPVPSQQDSAHLSIDFRIAKKQALILVIIYLKR
jgi:hypothetical protein